MATPVKSSAPTQKEWAAAGNPGVAPFSKTQIDPFKVALKYGYTAQDFVKDPGFAAYWANKSEAELTQALKRRSDFNEHSSSKKTEGEVVVNEGSDKWVDDQIASERITKEQGAVIKVTLNGNDFTSGNKLPTDAEIKQMVADAKVIAEASLNPYYERTTQRELSDLKTSLGDIRDTSKLYKETEAASYADTLAKAKQSLRARGLTFSGTSTAQLGNEGALTNDFGIEGSIPQNRRYDWQEKLAGWQKDARDLGMKAERDLGSAGISSNADYLQANGLVDPYGYTQGLTPGTTYNPNQTGTLYLAHKDASQPDYVGTGDLELQRLKAIEEAANKATERKTS